MKGDSMNKRQIEQEFKKVDFELRVNKLETTPYSPEVVKRREFLLFAQVHLNNILVAKSKNDRFSEKFETEMYHKVMEVYNNWDKNE